MEAKDKTLAGMNKQDIDVDKLMADLKAKAEDLGSHAGDVGYSINGYNSFVPLFCRRIEPSWQGSLSVRNGQQRQVNNSMYRCGRE